MSLISYLDKLYAFPSSKPPAQDNLFVVVFGCLLGELAQTRKPIQGKRQAEMKKKIK